MFMPLLAAILVGIFCPRESSARSPAFSKCATGEHRQFDFWTGDWDAYGLDEGNKLVARARVDVILDGCALLEVYEQLDGLTGQSLSIYDASRGTWHQTWVTNRGKLLTLEGRFQDGRMTLTGADRSADGRPILIRGVWKRAEAGVRETAETSEDGGKSWKPLFDILFRARPPASKARRPRRLPPPTTRRPWPRSIRSSGSATPTSGRRPGGVTSLARPRVRFPTRTDPWFPPSGGLPEPSVTFGYASTGPGLMGQLSGFLLFGIGAPQRKRKSRHRLTPI